MTAQKESANLDLLRSVAVLSVLADHVAATHGIAQNHPFLFTLGYWGVLLFFVHTSFVLMMSMERLRLPAWKLHWTFYLRRIFRIYPLSLATVALALLFHIPHRSWDSQYQFFDHKAVLTNILLCQNLTLSRSIIGPMWSLPYEIQMYALLPALFLIVRRKRSAVSLVGIWLAALGFGVLQARIGNTVIGTHLRIDRLGIAQYVPCFLAGVTAYFLSLRRGEARLKVWLWPVGIGLITAIYLRWQHYAPAHAYSGWACCLAVGLLVTQCRESSIPWINRVTHLIAKYSYGLYLGQVPVLWLAFVRLHYLPVLAQWSIFAVLIIVMPILSYHFVERPFIRIGTALSSSRQKSERLVRLAEPVAS